MKKYLFLFLLFPFVAYTQVVVSTPGATSSISVTNNLSDIGWQRDGSANVFLFALTDFVGIGIANPTEMLHLVSSTAFEPTLKLEGTAAVTAQPTIIFHANDATPSSGATIAQLEFKGDDSGNAEQQYSTILAYSEVVTAGDEAGKLQFNVTMDATGRNFLILDGFNGIVDRGEIILNEDSQDVDFRIESDNDVDAFFVEGSSGEIGMGINAPLSDLHIFSSVANSPVVRIETTNESSAGPLLILYLNSSSPADNDRLGRRRCCNICRSCYDK